MKQELLDDINASSTDITDERFYAVATLVDQHHRHNKLNSLKEHNMVIGDRLDGRKGKPRAVAAAITVSFRVIYTSSTGTY